MSPILPELSRVKMTLGRGGLKPEPGGVLAKSIGAAVAIVGARKRALMATASELFLSIKTSWVLVL